jgi:hypothetical protein
VLFDARGRVQHVTRGGRVYEFVQVREAASVLRELSLG